MDKNQLLEKIKQKKELSGLSNILISEIIESYLAKNKLFIHELNPSKLKVIIKAIRAELRLYAGRFQKPFKKRHELLKQNKVQELLKTHLSTEERLHYYSKLKRKINSLNPSSVLDLGCGINPIALANKKIRYYAADINEEDLSFVREYFEKKKIKGKVFYYNLKNIKSDLPKADVCLIFKVFDIIETKGHKLAERIIKAVPCKYIIISFPTKTLSKAAMRHPQRGWIERLFNRLEYKFKSFKSENEIFYLAEKLAQKQIGA